MTITLPKEPIQGRGVKIFHSANYDSDPVELPYTGIKGRTGFELANFDRVTVDGYDSCVLRHYAGRIIDREGLKNVSDTVDLIGQVIYVMVERDDGSYYTEWVGRCYAKKETPEPGASVNLAVIEYHCTGIIRDLEEVIVDYFGDYEGTTLSRGNPGYNMLGGIAIGDRDDTATVVDFNGYSLPAHRIPANDADSNTVPWTNAQVITHGLIIAAAVDKITSTDSTPIAISDPTGLLNSVEQVPVDTKKTTVADVVRMLANKARGITAFFDWTVTADVAKPTSIVLKCLPRHADDITYTNPKTGSPVTINGASTNNSTIAIDLIGDHRLVDGSFMAAEVATTGYDRLESFSEKIQLLVTVHTQDGTLEQAWTSDQETDWSNRGLKNPEAPDFATVFRSWNVTVDSGGRFGNAKGTGTKQAANYELDDAGNIQQSQTYALSTMSLTVLPDTPLLNGIDYSSSSLAPINATDPLTEGVRLPAQAFRWDLPTNDVTVGGGTEKWINPDRSGSPVARTNSEWLGFTVSSGGNGGRTLSLRTSFDSVVRYYQTIGKVGSNAAAQLDSDVVLFFTIGIELPTRIRLADNRSTTSGRQRTKRQYFPGLHLHLAHPLAVYDLASDGQPRYGAAGGTGNIPGIIRDDRDRLAALHAVAKEWHLTKRKTIGYSIRCAGFGYFLDADETHHNYPTMGQVITTASYAGATHTVDTPVTRITYDHDSQTTSWTTDWANRDWSR